MIYQTDAEKTAQKVFDEGHGAYPGTPNPYPKNSPEYNLWKQGADFRYREHKEAQELEDYLYDQHHRRG